MKNIHVLSTNKPSRLVYDTNDDLNLTSMKMVQEFSNKKVHIYITSDEEIKDGDYYYDNIVLQVRQWKSFMIYNKLQHKKIIATTDASLGLPQPSQQFIEKYIEEYNKGNVITDVLVEYEYLLDDRTVLPYWKLKMNTKNNTITITIKKLKETYSKDEVYQILEKYTSFIWNEVGIHYPISLGNDAKDKFINREL